MKSKLARICLRILAVQVSLILSISLAEIVVRITRPRLRELATADYQRTPYRIWENPKNARKRATHPDTGEKHWVIRNSQGFRQHREIDGGQMTRLGFFGDSFTENVRLGAEYSFTEPLDYLLNESGIAAATLNFGVDGYGTDQSCLTHADEPAAKTLDYVFYVFCDNDLLDNQVNGLFARNENGETVYQPRLRESGWLRRAAGRLCLTYLVMESAPVLGRPSDLLFEAGTVADADEVNARKSRARAAGSPAADDGGLVLFSAILAKFHAAARERSQRFVVVLLPRKPEVNRRVLPILDQLGIPCIDLHERLSRRVPELRPLFFQNDSHWNEEGNRLAALEIADWVTNDLGKPAPAREEMERKLAAYYEAFASDTGSEKIRSRYLALNPDGG